MAYKVTDLASKEQVVVYLRAVDEHFEAHEEPVELHQG